MNTSLIPLFIILGVIVVFFIYLFIHGSKAAKKEKREQERLLDEAPPITDEKLEGLRAARGVVLEKKMSVEKFGTKIPTSLVNYGLRISETDGTELCIFVTKEQYFSVEERQVVDFFMNGEDFVCFADDAKDIHYMTLDEEPFEKIRDGEKTIELRLWDEKRSRIKVGDKICFRLKNGDGDMFAKVVALHRFPSFEELYKNLPLEKCGYTKKEAKSASPDDMRAYYSAEDERKYGVVGIEIDLDIVDAIIK